MMEIEDEGLIQTVLNNTIVKYGLYKKEDIEDIEQELWLLYLVSKKEIEQGRHKGLKISTVFYNKCLHSLSKYFAKQLDMQLEYKDYILLRKIRRLEGKGLSIEDINKELNIELSIVLEKKIKNLAGYTEAICFDDIDYNTSNSIGGYSSGVTDANVEIFIKKWNKVQEGLKYKKHDLEIIEDAIFDILDGKLLENIKIEYSKHYSKIINTLNKMKKIDL